MCSNTESDRFGSLRNPLRDPHLTDGGTFRAGKCDRCARSVVVFLGRGTHCTGLIDAPARGQLASSVQPHHSSNDPPSAFVAAQTGSKPDHRRCRPLSVTVRTGCEHILYSADLRTFVPARGALRLTLSRTRGQPRRTLRPDIAALARASAQRRWSPFQAAGGRAQTLTVIAPDSGWAMSIA